MSLKSMQRTVDYAALAKDAVRLRCATGEAAREKAHRHLSRRMGCMRGLPQKLGQMLSFSMSGNNDERTGEYALLQESAEPLPWKTIDRVLAEAWGCDLQRHIAEIEWVGRAASLGQVHRARLHDGREVAIKVQYPGMQAAIRTDLSALGWLSAGVGNLRQGFDLDGYREAIRDGLDEELDYVNEAARQTAFACNWREDDSVIVPVVVNELTRPNVLVTQWEDGEHWDEIRAKWTRTQRRQLATTLLRVTLRGLLQHGMIQADWHPGNLRFRHSKKGAELVMYDFGSMCQPDRQTRIALARLILAAMKTGEPPWPLFMAMGFDADYLRPLAKKLPALCRVLFEPFCSQHPYDACQWALSERVEGILGDDRWNLRLAGPPTLIYLMRAFHGLLHYVSGLHVAVDWRTPFLEVVEDLHPQLNALKLPCEDEVEHADFGCLARHMKILVTENGHAKVQITQPATNIERLNELLDDELQRRILDAGICLKSIVADVRQRAFAPGPVFDFVQGNKQVKVSLEN